MVNKGAYEELPRGGHSMLKGGLGLMTKERCAKRSFSAGLCRVFLRQGGINSEHTIERVSDGCLQFASAQFWVGHREEESLF